MIRLEECSRWYGQVIGVNDISAEIGPGVTALLGQNGAGKSTLLNMITGQLHPTSGTVTVFDEIPFANVDMYRRLGYCPDVDAFPEHLTGRAFIERTARMHGLGAMEGRERAAQMLEQVGMTHAADKRIRGYSKGMRQRVKLASAMLHDPDILLLDEPLNGLDPVGRVEFMNVLRGLAERGKAVIVSSHILFEVEQMTRSILLLHRGRLLASGDLGKIRDLIDRHPHRIRLATEEPRKAASILMALEYVVSAEIAPDGESVEVRTRQPNDFYEALPGLCLDQNIPIYSVTSPDNNLEAVFSYLVETP